MLEIGQDRSMLHTTEWSIQRNCSLGGRATSVARQGSRVLRQVHLHTT